MYQGRRMRDAEATKSLCFKKKGQQEKAKRDGSQECKVQKTGRLDPLSPQFLSKIEGGWSHTTLTLPPTPTSTPIVTGVYERSGFPCQMVIHFLSSFLTCSIWGSLHVCIFNIIVLLLAISHARASFSDPGKLQLIYVNPQKLIYCYLRSFMYLSLLIHYFYCYTKILSLTLAGYIQLMHLLKEQLWYF